MTLQISDKSNWKTILSGIEISLECLIFASFHREPKIVRSCSSSYFKLWTFINSRAFQSIIRTVKCMWKSKTFLLWKVIIAYLKLFYLEYIRYLLTRKRIAGFLGWKVGQRWKQKCSFCPRKWFLWEIFHVVKTYF